MDPIAPPPVTPGAAPRLVVPPAVAGREGRVTILSPWRHPGCLWRALCHVVLAPLVVTVEFVVTIVLLSTASALVPIVLPAIPLAWLLFVVSRGIGRFERGRANALLDAGIVDPIAPLTAPRWWGRLLERLRSGARWREIGHHLLAFPVHMVLYALNVAAWCGSVALLLLPLYVGALPGDSAKFWLLDVGTGGPALAAAGVGLVGLVLVAPWTTTLSAAAERRLARWLLGPSAEAVLEAQVTRLETSRSAAVDSAEAERRRIERDLHDGAQQRLVALAANLGAAKEKLDVDPEAAKAMVADAHTEAKAALKEIRDLVRGIHPVILEDRGLDAALSAVVARAPVPVVLDVQPMQRPPAAVESAAYFVVNEALTNVARHAHATRAHVSVARAGDRLVVEVRDDGVGGADASLGSGLQGLRDRVAGLGGTMVVISPPGGPTTLSVELPCGS